ncbi:MAG: histidine phosphatase family protein [Opitutales bacterium]
MKLYLVRHAEALHFNSDPMRGLSERGVGQAHAVAKFLRGGGQFLPDEIWHSGLPRSTITAQILRDEAAPDSDLVERPDIMPESCDDLSYDALCKCEKSVAIVGHQPHLQHLFSRIVCSSDPEMWEIVNGGVACINGQDYYVGMGNIRRRWSLFWMLTPRLLGTIDNGQFD